MKLRITLALLAMLFVSSYLRATDTSRVQLQLWGEYGYNYAISNYADLAATALWHATPAFDLYGGVRMKIPGIYGLEAATRYNFPVGSGLFFIENRYLWQIYDASNMQEVNSALLLGYSRGQRFEAKVGVFNKFYTTIRRPDYNTDFILEPLHLAYYIAYNFFPDSHRFNIGLRMYTIDQFTVERPYSPFHVLHLHYGISSRCRVFADLRLHNSGIIDLNNNRFDSSIIAGTLLSW